MAEKKVLVDINLLQEVLNYLQEKPYHQVAPLIEKILNQVNKEEKI